MQVKYNIVLGLSEIAQIPESLFLSDTVAFGVQKENIGGLGVPETDWKFWFSSYSQVPSSG